MDTTKKSEDAKTMAKKKPITGAASSLNYASIGIMLMMTLPALIAGFTAVTILTQHLNRT